MVRRLYTSKMFHDRALTFPARRCRLAALGLSSVEVYEAILDLVQDAQPPKTATQPTRPSSE